MEGESGEQVGGDWRHTNHLLTYLLQILLLTRFAATPRADLPVSASIEVA